MYVVFIFLKIEYIVFASSTVGGSFRNARLCLE